MSANNNNIVIPTNLPVGFRFHPTDEELISHYLRLKLLGRDSEVDPIVAEVDFSNSEPWSLPSMSRIRSSDGVWWFFSRRDGAYRSGKRAKRKTASGFWKVTGLERKIKAKNRPSVIIGTKRTLVFYMGSSPGKRTNWIMQEYCSHPHQRDYVICRLKLKSDDAVDTPNNGDEDGPSGEISDFGNPITPVPIPAEVDAEALNSIESSIPRGEQEMSLASQNDVTTNLDEHAEIQALRGSDESEESASRFADSLIVDPNVNYYHVETTRGVSNISSLPTLSKRAYFQGGQVSSDSDAKGSPERQVLSLTSSSLFGSRRALKKRMAKTRGETSESLTAGRSTPENVLPLLSRNLTITTAKQIPHKWETNCLDVALEDREKRIRATKKLSRATTFGNEAVGREAFDARQKDISSGGSENGSESVVRRSEANKRRGLGESSSSGPPVKYWFNSVVGVVLFAVFARELMLHGSWWWY